MAIRESWASGTASFDAEELRVHEAATWTPATNAVKALGGIKPGPNNPGAVTATGTPDGFVHVAPFTAVIASTRATNAGVYTLTVDATVDINVLATPANATNPRNDLVIAHVPDTFYGDANSTPVVRTVVGTPSGSPADPSLAAYPDAITLARVRVDALATTITTAKITDLRPANTVAVGGLLPTATSTTRNALTGLYDGLQVYRKDRDWTEIYDGTAFRVQSLPIVSSTSDLSAITNPATGATAFNTADDAVYRYNSTWRRADWDRAWGIIGGKVYSSTTGNLAAGVTSEVGINMDTGSISTLANRRYRIYAKLISSVTTTGANLLILIRDNTSGGTERGRWFSPNMNTGISYTYPVVLAEWSEASDATRTYVVTGRVWTGGGSTTFARNDGGNYALVCVEDLGPSSKLTVT